MSTLSFTGERRVRFPAPDVARGFMLALIALANVPFWVRFFPDYPAPGQVALDAMSGVDQWWFLLRALFVDRRAYPLFSILFGFGMAIMAKRTIERERRARRAASRLIRRRGWWMLAFGAVHSVIFQGDIIGAYGLVAVIFAEVIVMRRVWLRAVIGVTGASLSLLLLSSGAAEMGARPMTLEYHAQATLEATTPLWNLAGWLVSTPFTVLTTLVVPCVMLGVGVERWGALQDPSGHRGALVAIAGGGLLAGALGALPYVLGQLDWAHVGGSGWTFPLFHASGVAGACGWLALLALLGGGPHEASAEFAQSAASFEELGAFRSFLSAIGRRSMTAYLAQTLVFAVLFLVLGAVGVRSVGVAVSALIALAVWALIGVGCVISDAMGRTRGPAERLLRWLVARTAWTLPLPKLPMSIYGAPTPGAVQNLGVKGAPKAMMSVSRDAEGVLPDSLDGMQNDANS